MSFLHEIRGVSLNKIYLSKSEISKSLFLSPTDECEIVDIIKLLTPKKSSGHDGVSTCFVKSIYSSISLPRSIIINKSLGDGTVPQDLKIAKILYIKIKLRINLVIIDQFLFYQQCRRV